MLKKKVDWIFSERSVFVVSGHCWCFVWFEHPQLPALVRRLQSTLSHNGFLPCGGFRYAPSPAGKEPASRLGSTEFTDNFLHYPLDGFWLHKRF